MCCRFCQRESGGRTGQNSPRLYALLAFLLRRWPANAGKSCPAILAVKRHAANPSVGVRRQLPLHKGAIFAWANTTGLARERSMGAASRWSGVRTAKTLPGCMLCCPWCSRRGGPRLERGQCAILAARRRKGRLDAMGLTIPPAWPCHAVPPLHKGGCGEPPLAKLSLPGWTQPA